jgi:hypothetical protein
MVATLTLRWQPKSSPFCQTNPAAIFAATRRDAAAQIMSFDPITGGLTPLYAPITSPDMAV